MSIRHSLLALLSEGPSYGLRLQHEFEARTGEVWPLNAGQVYTTLQRLERDGLVTSEDQTSEGPQKTYAITDSGRSELLDWLRTPPHDATPPRDELVIKVMIALAVPDVDVVDVIQAHRRRLVEAMQRYTQIKSMASSDDLALLLVADAELFRLEGVVRWLDAADVRIRQTATQTVELPEPTPSIDERVGR